MAAPSFARHRAFEGESRIAFGACTRCAHQLYMAVPALPIVNTCPGRLSRLLLIPSGHEKHPSDEYCVFTKWLVDTPYAGKQARACGLTARAFGWQAPGQPAPERAAHEGDGAKGAAHDHSAPLQEVELGPLPTHRRPGPMRRHSNIVRACQPSHIMQRAHPIFI